MSAHPDTLFRRAVLALLATAGAGAVHGAALQPVADGWTRWSVPQQPGVSAPCCWTLDRRGGLDDKGCALDDTMAGTAIDHRAADTTGDHVWVYLKRKGGRTLSARSVGSDCPVRADVPVLTLADVGPADSVAFLAAQLADGGRRGGDELLAAIAFHGDVSATAALIAASAAPASQERREQALFWLGEARGEAGVAHVMQVAAEDRSSRIRTHSLFVLSQSALPQARDALRERTRHDPDASVRSQGLFWLAQVDDPQALPLGLAVLADTAQSGSHDDVVFALSQLPDGKGDEALIALVDGDYPRPVKEQALFWLGQSGSDTALRYLDRLLADAGG